MPETTLNDENSISRGIDECYLIPGPTKMSQATMDAMALPVMTHRSPEFKAVMSELHSLLRMSFNLNKHGEDNYSVMMVSGSGTAAMEMAIANRFTKTDNVLVPTNGKFGERVAQLCKIFSQVTQLEYEWGKGYDMEEIERYLSSGNHSAIAFCHNETSTGITQDADKISLLAKKYGVALILDGITSVGGLPVHPAKWNAEAVVVGAQKCTAGPSGVAALAVNSDYINRVKEIRSNKKHSPTYYLDILPAINKGMDDQTPWTPAINLAFGWLESLRELAEEGLEKRWQRCKIMSDGVANLFLDLGFELFAEKENRSTTVTAILYPEGIDDDWRTHLHNRYRTSVIGAQDHMKGKMFRVGSMGITPISEMIEGCKRMIECFREFGVDLPDKVDVAAYFE